MEVKMDPEIAAIFKASTAVSLVKGNSNNMMKASSKRRRGKEEIRLQNAQEEEQKRQIKQKLEEYERLKSQEDANNRNAEMLR
jgi:hypothetical protein